MINKSHTLPHQCFDLFGFDILIDSTLTPWLLEVNMCPSLSSSSKLDKKIKTTLLCDVFHLIGIKKFSHFGGDYESNTIINKRKVNFSDVIYDPFKDHLNEKIEFADNDLETLLSFTEEWSRTGDNMERIFPLKRNCRYYSKFFECKRRNNYLLWRYLLSKQDILKKYKA